jgi:hypothetical protein
MDGENGPGGVNGNNGMTRAERFEDEKRRIIESCFGKKDDDGSCKRNQQCDLDTFDLKSLMPLLL